MTARDIVSGGDQPAGRSFGALAGSIEGGPDRRAPLILLHGLTFDRAMWRPAVAELRKLDPGRRVLAVDLPGHGSSPAWPRYDFANIAEGVHRVAAAAKLRAPVIVGHSAAAAIATVYAARYPARGVINVDQWLQVEPVARLLRSRAGQIRGPGFPGVWEMFEASMHIELLPRAAQELLRSARYVRQDLVTGYWRDLLDRPVAELTENVAGALDALRGARMPYLFIAGHEVDPGYRDWLNHRLPQANVTVWPGSGHFPHLAHPGASPNAWRPPRGGPACAGAADSHGVRIVHPRFTPPRVRDATASVLVRCDAAAGTGPEPQPPAKSSPPKGGAKKGTTMTALTRSSADRLRARFRGELISPGDDGYDAARRVWNGAIDRHPALIARARCTADVVAAVRFASERGLPVSIRGGGHSAAGFAVADSALMLDLSAMKAARADPAARTVVAGPGLVWSELDAVTQGQGLATTGGVVGSTGIAGLTLGGGIGYLDRLAGLTCDNLLAAEVVTAAGQVLRASADEHPDLFWALRGGGGNFGVVTSFTYRLHPVTEVYGGLLGYTIDHATEVLRAYRDVSASAPDRLALYASMVTAPPAPFVPEHLRGQRVIGLIPVYFGPAAEAAPTLAPLRELAPPVLDMAGPTSYQQVQQLTDGLNPPTMHHYYTAEWLHSLDDQTIEALVAAAIAAPSPHSVIVIKRMGGAAGRVPASATPFWYRDAAHNLDIHAQWAPGSPAEPHIAWARNTRQAARHASAGGGYVNFLGADQGRDRVRAAYGGNYERLAQIKAAYDPDNFFHLNTNIPPAVPAGRGEASPALSAQDGEIRPAAVLGGLGAAPRSFPSGDGGGGGSR